jgi:predicted alpha/beta hydrolase
MDAAPLPLLARDGRPLGARLFRPGGAPRGAVLLVNAMGVGQGFYAPLGAWLAGEGFLTATFDYRGVGRSRAGPLREERADVLDWARLDAAAALDALAGVAPGLPLSWVGHSLGGQVLPFVDHARLARAVTVAAGSGYWRENTPSLRRVSWLLWYLAVPISMPLAGYFPGRRLGMIGDLPRGVMAQWRRWCLDPDYLVGVEGPAARAAFAAVRVPVTALSLEDDEYMSWRNVEALHACYTGTPVRHLRLAPADAGGPVGHFGFFRPGREDALWRRWLLPELEATGR